MRIRSHLIILVLAVTLPVLIFSAVLTVVFWRQHRLALEQRFLERVRAMSIALDAELDGHIQGLQILARSQLLQTGDLRGFYERAARIRADRLDWATVTLTDSGGRELFNLRLPFGTQLPEVIRDPEALSVVVKTGRPAVSRLYKNPISGALAIAVMVPVKRDGAVQYVLGAVIESSAWLNFLSRYPTGGDATMTLLDQQGVVIARTLNNDRWAGKPAAPPLYEHSRKMAEGAYRSVGPEGQQFYSAHSRSKLSGWTIADGGTQGKR